MRARFWIAVNDLARRVATYSARKSLGAPPERVEDPARDCAWPDEVPSWVARTRAVDAAAASINEALAGVLDERGCRDCGDPRVVGATGRCYPCVGTRADGWENSAVRTSMRDAWKTEKVADALHPTGKCRCAGGGICDWCLERTYP